MLQRSARFAGGGREALLGINTIFQHSCLSLLDANSIIEDYGCGIFSTNCTPLILCTSFLATVCALSMAALALCWAGVSAEQAQRRYDRLLTCFAGRMLWKMPAPLHACGCPPRTHSPSSGGNAFCCAVRSAKRSRGTSFAFRTLLRTHRSLPTPPRDRLHVQRPWLASHGSLPLVLCGGMCNSVGFAASFGDTAGGAARRVHASPGAHQTVAWRGCAECLRRRTTGGTAWAAPFVTRAEYEERGKAAARAVSPEARLAE